MGAAGIAIIDSSLSTSARVEVRVPQQDQPLAYRVSRSYKDGKWHVIDPTGAHVTQAATRDEALRLARDLAEVLYESALDSFAC